MMKNVLQTAHLTIFVGRMKICWHSFANAKRRKNADKKFEGKRFLCNLNVLQLKTK